jgi:hypothetical protein
LGHVAENEGDRKYGGSKIEGNKMTGHNTDDCILLDVFILWYLLRRTNYEMIRVLCPIELMDKRKLIKKSKIRVS